MKTWHYNIINIVKNVEFRDALKDCLDSLEKDKDHSIVLSMLSNYFNSRNAGFTSNWLYLPKSRVTLYINKKGVYFLPESTVTPEKVALLTELNAAIYEAIGYQDWVVTFTKTKPPNMESKENS